MASSIKEIKAIFKEFPKTTSIHGILQLFNLSYGKFVRFIWLIIFLSMLVLCITQSYLNIQQYLQFEVETSTVIESQTNLAFPTITFCSKYFIRNQLFGNSSYSPINLAAVFAQSKTEFEHLVNKIGKTCMSNYVSKTSQLLEKYNTDDSLETLASFQQAWEEDVKTMVSTFESDVVKCWWQEKEDQCNNMFINRFTDANYCFTFNTGNHLAKDPTLWKLFGAHGLNATNYDEKTYKVGNWVKNKLRLLMNVNQKFLCGGSISSGGVGFEAIFKNSETPPLNSFDTSIKLRLSHVNNVIIKPKSWRRYTEHMGLCKSKVDLYMFPQANLSNVQPVCFLQCAVVKIFKKCKCYPLHWAPLEDVFRRNYKKMGIEDPNKTIKPCGREETMCCLDFQRKEFIAENYRTFCPECVQPCFEDKYDYLITYSQLNIDRLKLDITNESLKFNRSDKDLRKNFLYANFGFEDKNVEIVTEKQAITIVDLFIFIGNNIGLFMGASFLSPFEIIIGLMGGSLTIFFRNKFTNWLMFRQFSFNLDKKDTIKSKKAKIIKVNRNENQESTL